MPDPKGKDQEFTNGALVEPCDNYDVGSASIVCVQIQVQGDRDGEFETAPKWCKKMSWMWIQVCIVVAMLFGAYGSCLNTFAKNGMAQDVNRE